MMKNERAASLPGLDGSVVLKASEAGNYLTTVTTATEIDVREYAARHISQRLSINMPIARLVSLHAGLAVAA